jgi:hypothetical protein
MNTSILRRVFVSDPVSKDFTPWFIEFFALACAFGCVDSIREHSAFKQWLSFAMVSLLLAIIGFKWMWIKTKVATFTKSRALRIALAENAELRMQLAERTPAVQTLPAQTISFKPLHF